MQASYKAPQTYTFPVIVPHLAIFLNPFLPDSYYLNSNCLINKNILNRSAEPPGLSVVLTNGSELELGLIQRAKQGVHTARSCVLHAGRKK